MGTHARPRGQPAPARAPRRAGRSCCPYPILTNDELAKLLYINDDSDMPGFKPFAIDGLYPVAEGGEGLRRALEEVRAKVERGHRRRRQASSCCPTATRRDELAPIPSLLLTAAVHHHLIREKTRTQVGLVVECGDAREVHHMALLLGYGAAAINPYLAFETIEDLIDQGVLTGVTKRQAVQELRQGQHQGRAEDHVEDGHLDGGVLHRRPGVRGHRPGRATSSTSTSPAPPAASAASGLDVLAEEVAARHRFAHLDRPEEAAHRDLWAGGEYQWRREGEHHLFNPETVFKLQHATRTKRYDIFKEYTRQGRRPGPQAGHAPRPVRAPRTTCARRCRSTRSSRSARSSSASPPAP